MSSSFLSPSPPPPIIALPATPSPVVNPPKQYRERSRCSRVPRVRPDLLNLSERELAVAGTCAISSNSGCVLRIPSSSASTGLFVVWTRRVRNGDYRAKHLGQLAPSSSLWAGTMSGPSAPSTTPAATWIRLPRGASEPFHGSLSCSNTAEDNPCGSMHNWRGRLASRWSPSLGRYRRRRVHSTRACNSSSIISPLSREGTMHSLP